MEPVAKIFSEKKSKSKFYFANNWPLLRKFEALVFASMFIAVPLFALRVVQRTSAKLVAMNVSVDLVHDLRKAKENARNHKTSVTITSCAPMRHELNSYTVVEEGSQTIEKVKLPSGVSIVGSVRFDKEGLPERNARFLINKDTTTVCIDVDSRGVITAP